MSAITKCINAYRNSWMFEKNRADHELTADNATRELADFEKLNELMPCGHLARYATANESGTQYCVMCAAVQTESKLAIAEGALARIKAKESEFEDRVNDTPPQSVPWWNLGDIAAAALKRMEAIK